MTVAEFLNRQMHLRRLDEWEDLDMTIPQIKTLVLLERLGSLRMGSISMHLGRALSATTTVVGPLGGEEVGGPLDPHPTTEGSCYAN